MKCMNWLVALVVLLLVASIPATDAWAKGKGREGDGRAGDAGDKGKDRCKETPTPSVAAIADREASFVWFVMDRTDPTRRLAGPFYHEQTCKASSAGFNNSMCRVVRG